ncbi:MAG: hypothetical protein AB7P08_06720 [Burkholderiales bacterium]
MSDFYLPEDDHLGQEDYHQLLRLGWHPPTRLPREFGHDFDSSPNYFLDLAQPVAVEDLAVMAVLTLIHVHAAGHPGRLEIAHVVAGAAKGAIETAEQEAYVRRPLG